MEDLLKNEFIAHYSLPPYTSSSFLLTTNAKYFEIEDSENREILIHQKRGSGMARFSNPTAAQISVINYDKFISNLVSHFQKGRKRCDILVVSEDYFVLGELKDRNILNKRSRHSVRKTAKEQLYQSLGTLINVQEILNLIDSKTSKRCCYFNKHQQLPRC